MQCPECNGNGYIDVGATWEEYELADCTTCEGTGTIMARDPLDLRGLSLTELMEMDAERSIILDNIELAELVANASHILADRRQIREAMEALRGQVAISPHS